MGKGKKEKKERKPPQDETPGRESGQVARGA
jgi:hypothetical protein